MSVYLDPSVLICLIVPDVGTPASRSLVETCGQPIVASDFAVLEVASALGRKVRMNEISAAAARTGLADFRIWLLRNAEEATLRSEDLVYSEAALARFDLTLKAPDALHIAVACRLGATLATFDARKAESAISLGVSATRL